MRTLIAALLLLCALSSAASAGIFGSRGGSSEFPPDLSQEMYIQDEFIATRTTSGEIGELGWLTSLTGSCSVSAVAATIGQEDIGRFQVATGTTASSVCTLYLPAIFRWNTTSILRLPLACFIVVGPTSSTNYTVRVGLMSDQLNPPTNGVYLEYIVGTDTTWKFVTRDGFGETRTDTTHPMTPGHNLPFCISNNSGTGAAQLQWNRGGPNFGLFDNLTNLYTDPMSPSLQLINNAAQNKSTSIEAFSYSYRMQKSIE